MRYSITGSNEQEVKGNGGKNISVQDVFGIIFADMTPNQAQTLSTKPGVTVTQVKSVQIPGTGVPRSIPASASESLTPDVLLERINMKAIMELAGGALDGSGTVTAVIDTGIRKTHQRMGDMVVYEKNFSSATGTNDGFNHGTGVADIIRAFAPATKLINLKVLDDHGAGTEEQVVNALAECVRLIEQDSEFKPDVINMSLGSPDDGNPNNPIRIACRKLVTQYNVLICAAAGNNGPTEGTILCPASEPLVFAVGACELPNLTLCDFSSRGPTKEGITKPDFLQVGKNFLVASSVSDTAQRAVSGTSFSTPTITGILPLFKQGISMGRGISSSLSAVVPGAQAMSGLTFDQVSMFFALGCRKPGEEIPLGSTSVKDNNYGYGSPLGPVLAQMYTLATGGSQVIMTLMFEGMMSLMMTIMVLIMMFKLMIKQMAK